MAGLTCKIDYAQSETVPRGIIISQKPKAGEYVKKESFISIIVSLGKKEVPPPPPEEK